MTARYQVHTGRWVRAAKWLALGATYVMNTWASFAAGSLSGVVLHSVPTLIVFAAAEAITDLQDKLTEAASNPPCEVGAAQVVRRLPRRREASVDA